MKNAMVLLGVVMIIGCTPSRMSPSEYMEWANRPDNPLKQARQMGNYEFTLQYRPVDLLACEFFGTNRPNQSSLDSIRKETGNALFFTFRFKSRDHNSEVTPEELSYLSSDIQQDFFIIAGNDTILPSSCQYERDYGMTPYQTINLVFDNDKALSSGITFLYDDKILQTGPVAFQYERTHFSDLPKIQL